MENKEKSVKLKKKNMNLVLKKTVTVDLEDRDKCFIKEEICGRDRTFLLRESFKSKWEQEKKYTPRKI